MNTNDKPASLCIWCGGFHAGDCAAERIAIRQPADPAEAIECSIGDARERIAEYARRAGRIPAVPAAGEERAAEAAALWYAVEALAAQEARE